MFRISIDKKGHQCSIFLVKTFKLNDNKLYIFTATKNKNNLQLNVFDRRKEGSGARRSLILKILKMKKPMGS